MRRKRTVRVGSCPWGNVIAPAVLIALLCARPAHAYLDPGTGSLMLQMLLAVVFGAAVGIKMFWRQIKARVGGLFAKRSSSQDDEH
jgi:hypothetical protein